MGGVSFGAGVRRQFIVSVILAVMAVCFVGCGEVDFESASSASNGPPEGIAQVGEFDDGTPFLALAVAPTRPGEPAPGASELQNINLLDIRARGATEDLGPVPETFQVPRSTYSLNRRNVSSLGFNQERESATWTHDNAPNSPSDPFKPPVYTSDCFAYFDFVLPLGEESMTVSLTNGKLSATAEVTIQRELASLNWRRSSNPAYLCVNAVSPPTSASIRTGIS